MIKLLFWFSLVSYSMCKLTEFYRWKQIKYQHLNPDEDNIKFCGENSTTSNSPWEFIPYNNVPMSAVHFKDKLIVTVPRRKPGIPSSLNYVSVKLPKGSSPSLRPYPDIKTNELHPQLGPDNKRIVSVYRPRMDDCGRLWFVDTGTLQYSLPDDPNKTIHLLQRPSVWVIDMNTDKLVRRYEISESIVGPGHGMASITVDVDRKNCDAAFAYIPDLLTFRIHVYSLQQNKMWSFEHSSFKFEPPYANFDVDGFQYTWRDGIFSITLGNSDMDGYRTAYYHPMASLSEYAVSTKVLQNEAASKRSDHGNDFMIIGVRGEKSQCTMHSFDRHTGVIMYAQVAKNGFSCWNSANPLVENNIALIDANNTTMIYPVDLNVDREGTMWMVTNTMQRFIYGKLDPQTYNFRIWKAKVEDLIKGTVCQVAQN